MSQTCRIFCNTRCKRGCESWQVSCVYSLCHLIREAGAEPLRWARCPRAVGRSWPAGQNQQLPPEVQQLPSTSGRCSTSPASGRGRSLRRLRLPGGEAMLHEPRAASANDTDLHWVLACFAKKSQPDFFFSWCKLSFIETINILLTSA